MRYPAFFDTVPKIVLHDPLAEFLGATDAGIVEYAYLDAVKLAGHSCPTVAAAYGMTCQALAALYREQLPQRGNIRVEFGKAQDDGVTGVIANVVSLLTGAAADGGFKGIGGHFDRRSRVLFAVDMAAEVRFTRLDNGEAVCVTVDLHSIPSSPRMRELLPRCLGGSAGADECAEFRALWQGRVKAILLEHVDDPQVFAVVPA